MDHWKFGDWFPTEMWRPKNEDSIDSLIRYFRQSLVVFKKQTMFIHMVFPNIRWKSCSHTSPIANGHWTLTFKTPSPSASLLPWGTWRHNGPTGSLVMACCEKDGRCRRKTWSIGLIWDLQSRLCWSFATDMDTIWQVTTSVDDIVHSQHLALEEAWNQSREETTAEWFKIVYLIWRRSLCSLHLFIRSKSIFGLTRRRLATNHWPRKPVILLDSAGFPTVQTAWSSQKRWPHITPLDSDKNDGQV